ncbi:hypothetical protein D9756_009359 [Leucocoprinus leucothites]|uniref:Uncharacterized protein n=1 Tax=Leucocoprinus leucothites TaxID=201217 RepID=A0A8H5CZ05_9AGAR|nr:hypothetical protein D9756_009359 [Leucoagaricus leucothites]
MADPFKPSTQHSINPLDPKHPFLFIQDDNRASHIQSLTIFTEAASGELRSELTDFLDRLHALQKLVIHWKALDWVQLGEHGLRALVRLFSLPSLQELQVLASGNFPLCLLRYFAGKKLCIAATTLATAVMPLFPADTEARRLGALTDLSIVSARNIREFRTFIEWQTDKAQTCLQFVNCLRCSVSWRDVGAKPEDVMKDLGSLLLRFGAIARDFEELRLLDWQNNSFDGPQVAQSDLVSLTTLKRLYLHLGASPKASEKTMDSMNTSLRNWLFPLLTNLPSPQVLEVIDITFSFVVPFPWPTDLHTWMETFASELEATLDIVRFPRLQTANLTFDLRNAHTRPYNWQAFNATLHPARLYARGVACVFKAQVYRP